MAQIKLSRLVSRKNKVASIINDFITDTELPVGITDATGRLVLGQEDKTPPEKHPVICEDETLGWVTGGQQARVVATLVSYLAGKELEKKTLAKEVLDKYREINLLYKLSEKLAASLALQTVVEVALEESSRLIRGTHGAIMLAGEGALEIMASFGPDADPQVSIMPGQGIINNVMESGRAELVNETATDPRFHEQNLKVESLVCAPLKAKQKVIGLIFIGNQTPVTYTAGDLKLLNTIASQAAPAIDNALLYERELKAAKEREAKLRQQIVELRIEIDEAKRAQQVAEITETDYFRGLMSQADELRSVLNGGDK